MRYYEDAMEKGCTEETVPTLLPTSTLTCTIAAPEKTTKRKHAANDDDNEGKDDKDNDERRF